MMGTTLESPLAVGSLKRHNVSIILSAPLALITYALRTVLRAKNSLKEPEVTRLVDVAGMSRNG